MLVKLSVKKVWKGSKFEVQNVKIRQWKFHLHLRSFHFNSPVLGGLVQYGLKVIGETDEEKEFQ